MTPGVAQGIATPADINMEVLQAPGGYSGYDPFIAYDGFYLPNASYDQQQPGEIPWANHAFTNSAALGQSLANIDIDQDWGWFVNNTQLQSQQGFA